MAAETDNEKIFTTCMMIIGCKFGLFIDFCHMKMWGCTSRRLLCGSLILITLSTIFVCCCLRPGRRRPLCVSVFCLFFIAVVVVVVVVACLLHCDENIKKWPGHSRYNKRRKRREGKKTWPNEML